MSYIHKGSNQMLGLRWLYLHTKVKLIIWFRPIVNTDPGFYSGYQLLMWTKAEEGKKELYLGKNPHYVSDRKCPQGHYIYRI